MTGHNLGTTGKRIQEGMAWKNWMVGLGSPSITCTIIFTTPCFNVTTSLTKAEIPIDRRKVVRTRRVSIHLVAGMLYFMKAIFYLIGVDLYTPSHPQFLVGIYPKRIKKYSRQHPIGRTNRGRTGMDYQTTSWIVCWTNPTCPYNTPKRLWPKWFSETDLLPPLAFVSLLKKAVHYKEGKKSKRTKGTELGGVLGAPNPDSNVSSGRKRSPSINRT